MYFYRIFVANIEINTKADEVKGALSGCVSVTLLKPYNKKFRYIKSLVSKI